MDLSFGKKSREELVSFFEKLLESDPGTLEKYCDLEKLEATISWNREMDSLWREWYSGNHSDELIKRMLKKYRESRNGEIYTPKDLEKIYRESYQC